MPLILISGYPCSGKTYRANQLVEFFNSKINSTLDPCISRLSVCHINDQNLGLSRDVYREARSEKDARAAEYSAVKRALGRDTIVVADGLNYIKGFRYQLYCEAKAVQTPSCVVHVGTPIERCREFRTNRVEDPSHEGDYANDVFENLVYRYEEPNGMTRWDSPLFTVPYDDETPPFEAIWEAMVGSEGKAKRVKPNAATVTKPAAESDYLYELDKTSQEIMNAILQWQKDHPGEGGGELNVEENTIELPANPVSLPQLQRIREAAVATTDRLVSGIHQDEDEELETPEDMEIEENNEPVLRESTSKANQTRKGLPQTKVSKTGKVQELVTPKGPKSTDPIRGMQSRSRFDISRILDLPLELTVGELLDRSDITIKDLAFNMQRSTPRYRIKRSKVNAEGDTQEAENVQASMTISAAVLPPEVTARAYEDDGLSKPLMINSWIGTQRLPKSLLDGGSLVELLNRKVYNKMKPKPRIRTDGYIRVSLANDSVTILREYVLVPVNVEGIEAVIKAWLVDVEVYDLLLGVSWLRRVHCNQKYGQGKITVMGDDMTVREVPTQLMPVSTNLPVVEWLSMKEVGGRSVAHIGHGRLMGQCGAWRSNSLNWTHSALVILGGRPGVAYRLAYSVLETRASLWREVLS